MRATGGGTEPEFNDYNSLEIEGELATNSYLAWILSWYDSDIQESKLLMPEDSRQLTSGQWRRWNNLMDEGWKTSDEYWPSNSTTFLVQENLDCKGTGRKDAATTQKTLNASTD